VRGSRDPSVLTDGKEAAGWANSVDREIEPRRSAAVRKADSNLKPPVMKPSVIGTGRPLSRQDRAWIRYMEKRVSEVVSLRSLCDRHRDQIRWRYGGAAPRELLEALSRAQGRVRRIKERVSDVGLRYRGRRPPTDLIDQAIRMRERTWRPVLKLTDGEYSDAWLDRYQARIVGTFEGGETRLAVQTQRSFCRRCGAQGHLSSGHREAAAAHPPRRSAPRRRPARGRGAQ